MICSMVALAGSCAYGCKSDDPERLQNVINPTIVVIFFYLLFYVSAFLVKIAVGANMYYNPKKFVMMYFNLIELVVPFFVFPLTWIIVWTKNGDIRWKKLFSCCCEEKAEEMQLVQTKWWPSSCSPGPLGRWSPVTTLKNNTIIIYTIIEFNKKIIELTTSLENGIFAVSAPKQAYSHVT